MSKESICTKNPFWEFFYFTSYMQFSSNSYAKGIDFKNWREIGPFERSIRMLSFQVAILPNFWSKLSSIYSSTSPNT